MTVILRSDNSSIQAQRTAPAELLASLEVNYETEPLQVLLAQADVLAVIGFGANAPVPGDDNRYVRVALEPAQPPAPFEVWRARPGITQQRTGAIRSASDGQYSFAALELDEAGCGGIARTAELAYAALGQWLATSATPHVLRVWNYLDEINAGAGDEERYRQFCKGRALGMGESFASGFPAATAIGVRDGRRVLQVYWLAARSAGTPLENPRQVSAWRYPRQYGPAAPSFARAMQAPTQPSQLFLSGTAAIVGHASHHQDDIASQLRETLANIRSLVGAAGGAENSLASRHSVLKAYVRRPADEGELLCGLGIALDSTARVLVLRGDICRRELLVEIDGIHVP